MAFDLTAASDIERVVTQWLKAGRHAAARSAYKLNARPTRGDFLDPTRRRRHRQVGREQAWEEPGWSGKGAG